MPVLGNINKASGRFIETGIGLTIIIRGYPSRGGG
jgi:hypothetical protein